MTAFLSYTKDLHAAFLSWASDAARYVNIARSQACRFVPVHLSYWQARTCSMCREQTGAGSLEGQKRYCEFQRRNLKTRRMLEAAFGTEYAAAYMDTILFDLPA